MTVTLLDLSVPSSWPCDLEGYLAKHHDFFLDWETGRERATGAQYDEFTRGLVGLLRHCAAVGWHCTRLTEDEISGIRSAGMQPMSAAMLERRLDTVAADDLLSSTVAARLKAMHQARDQGRTGRIWFCFYPPRLAGEEDIERFFRHWGGEALYNFHEDDPVTSAALRTIGVPCVVEALVPLTGLSNIGSLADKIARRYLIARGHRTVEAVNHEGPITVPLDAANIREIWRFPSPEFCRVTGCDGWRRPIAG